MLIIWHFRKLFRFILLIAEHHLYLFENDDVQVFSAFLQLIIRSHLSGRVSINTAAYCQLPVLFLFVVYAFISLCHSFCVCMR
ncbi:hypothetical protein BDF19DRAFT_291990 [Syncephalis fuscata]|nr:hypothetical protein BDF19DRAFT_291990 [Syncephalis fuscata]